MIGVNDQHLEDFFIVGHGAADDVRKEMVAWIKSRYPQNPVLASNSSGIRPLDAAGFNVELNGPETWLPLVASSLAAEQCHKVARAHSWAKKPLDN